jgi:hypothetical protein
MSPHFDLLIKSSFLFYFIFYFILFFILFSQSFDFAALANHPQGDLATFGYNLGMKV